MGRLVVLALVMFVLWRLGHPWLAVLAAVGYAVWAYTHAWVDCWLCKGTGRNFGSTKRRRGKCWRCRGRREIRAPGARLLHYAVRQVRSTVSDWRGK